MAAFPLLADIKVDFGKWEFKLMISTKSLLEVLAFVSYLGIYFELSANTKYPVKLKKKLLILSQDKFLKSVSLLSLLSPRT